MIKCFIVKNVDNITPEGKFKINSFYIAKISCNKPNTFAVLDNDENWIPFKWYYLDNAHENEFCELYFDIWDEFLIENKKELNNYVPTTKFYE